MKKINYYFLVTILLSFTSINRFGNVYAQEAKPEAEATDFMSVIKKKKLAEEKAQAAAVPETKTEAKKEVAVVSSDQPIAPESTPVKKKKKKKKIQTTVRNNEPLTPSEQPKVVEKQEVLTSNWSGLRSRLAANGIEIEAVYKGEVSSNFSGGARKGTVYLGNFDLKTSINAEALLGWKGASAFIYLIVDHGKDPSVNVGDAQGTSNIETPVNTLKLYEAWVQQSFFDEKATILFGLHDLNSEFYVTETSGLFLNSSFGIGQEFAQTGKNGPSIFPTTSLAARVRAEPTKAFYIQTGIFNGVSGDPENPRGTHIKLGGANGLLIVSEMAFLRGKEEKSENKYSKYAAGIWSYTKTFDHQTATVSGTTTPVQVNNDGYYFLAEQTIFDPLAVFLRYGVASSEVNRFHKNFSYGLVATGIISSRPNDRLGIAATIVTNGSEYKDLNKTQGNKIENSESTYEASYRMELTKGFVFQPDIQWVVNPDTNPDQKNVLVGAVRFEITL